MKRYLGIDLHLNRFTYCVLHTDWSETIPTWPLKGRGGAVSTRLTRGG